MNNFIDSPTQIVLGTRDYLARLRPDSPAGEALAAEPRFFGPADGAAWRDEMERLVEAESFCHAEPSSEEHVRQALAELPLLDRPLRKLRVGEVLGEAELFTAKRFLYYAGEAVDASLDLVDGWGLPESCPEQVRGLMEAIHPQQRATPRFHLASELSDELDELRIELRQKKKRERKLRDGLEEAVIADHGGTFDIHDTYRPADTVAKEALADDVRLEQTHAGWKLADGELSELCDEIRELETRVEQVEYDLRAQLSDRLRDQVDWMEKLADTLALLDLRLAKVRLRREVDGCWADRRDKPGILIEHAREPQLLQTLERDEIQPVAVELGDAPVVVTGPNMGGKSVLLRLIGICQWCAQHAMPAPAARCAYSPVEAIIYVGSEEPQAGEFAQGLSSFGREVGRLVDWWNRGDSPKLWLLDELGRGTHPDEGAQIASEVIDKLAARGDRVVAATHFPTVAATPGAQKLRIAGLTDPGRLEKKLDGGGADVQAALRAAMDYRPLPVDTDQKQDVPRDARVVARALGLDIRSK